MQYKASLDKTAIIITTFVTVLFLVIIIGQYAVIKDGSVYKPIYTTVACVLIYAFAFSVRPMGYIITDETLIIRRPFKNILIKRSELAATTALPRAKLKGTIRLWGIGGLFGYVGSYINFSIGKMTWYATRKDKAVLIKTLDKKQIMVTPDNDLQFVNELTGIA